MRTLLGVELTRLRWRRAVLLLVIACVAIPGVMLAATGWNTRPVSDAELRQAQVRAEQESRIPAYQQELRACERHPRQYGAAAANPEATCERMLLPQADWFISRSELDLHQELESSGLGVAIVLTVLLLLVGTTFVGHDWSSGSMSNQLLFEPRRLRLWAAKGAVVLATGLVVAGAVLAAYWAGLWAIAAHRDVAEPKGLLGDVVTQVWRATLVAGFAALGGYALTMFFRSTVATLGVLFAVSIGGPLLIGALGLPDAPRLMPQNNYAAIVTDGFTYWAPPAVCPPESCQYVQRHLDPIDGAKYCGALVLLAGVPSLLSFRRRDVA